MNCHDQKRKDNDKSIPKHSRHNGFMMLLHMVPMFILFVFYEQLNQERNRIWLYILIILMVLAHVFMMSGMFKHKSQIEDNMNSTD